VEITAAGVMAVKSCLSGVPCKVVFLKAGIIVPEEQRYFVYQQEINFECPGFFFMNQPDFNVQPD
jgi:hypothetical protein